MIAPGSRWPATPYARYRTVVREEWIDYNGHLHDAGYAMVLSEANEMVLADLGLSEDYRVSTGRAMYTVQSHIRYLAESTRGDVLAAETLLASADQKRIRLHTTLTADDGRAIATGEHLYVHVDGAAGAVTALPPDRWEAVKALLSAHATLARPEHLGRGVGPARPAACPACGAEVAPGADGAADVAPGN